MKRSAGLRRRTPLKPATEPMMRVTPLRPRSDRKKADDRVLARSKGEVRDRSGDRCEVPQWVWPHDCTPTLVFHHRKRRSQGGGHDPSNLLHICTTVHDEIHAHPADAYAAGLLIRGGAA